MPNACLAYGMPTAFPSLAAGYSYGLCSYDIYSYGLYSYGLYKYRIYSYGLYSYGRYGYGMLCIPINNYGLYVIMAKVRCRHGSRARHRALRQQL